MTDEISNKVSNFKNKMNSLADELNTEFTGIINSINEENANVNEEKAKLQKEIDEWKVKYQEAQSKIEHIETQLNSTVKKLEDLSKDKNKEINALELLDVYLILMEQVFESAPHVRLLLMLHGEKDEYTLDELISGSGIGGLNVRKAVHELRNANVLDFDEENDKVKLKMRFLN